MSGNEKQVMEICKLILLAILFIAALVDIYFLLTADQYFRRDMIITLLLIGGVLLWRNKWTYLLALLVCVYGLYNLLFICVYAAEPTAMQFTTPVISLFRGDERAPVIWLCYILRLIPLGFYFFYLLFLITGYGRRYYGINSRILRSSN